MRKNIEHDTELEIKTVDVENSNYYDPLRKTILLDKKLLDYPELYREVLDHELEHYTNHVDSKTILERMCKDLKHDIIADFKRYSGLKTPRPGPSSIAFSGSGGPRSRSSGFHPAGSRRLPC